MVNGERIPVFDRDLSVWSSGLVDDSCYPGQKVHPDMKNYGRKHINVKWGRGKLRGDTTIKEVYGDEEKED